MSSSHQSKFPCIIITIIIILLFFSSFSTLLTVNLFVLFWRCFVMLNSYFVCFIIYIFFFNFEFFFVDIIFVPKIGVCFSFYPVSLIFEYEAKPHIRWPHIREYEAGESGANFTSVSSQGLNSMTFPGLCEPWLTISLGVGYQSFICKFLWVRNFKFCLGMFSTCLILLYIFIFHGWRILNMTVISLISVWKCLIQDSCYISQGPMSFVIFAVLWPWSGIWAIPSSDGKW